MKVIEYGSAVSKFAFFATSATQLSFEKGCEIVLIRKVDDNWYEGRINNGQKGYIPAAFVQIIAEPVTSSQLPPTRPRMRQSAPAEMRARRQIDRNSDASDDVFDHRVNHAVDQNLQTQLNRELNAAVSEMSTLALRVSEEFDVTMKENSM